MIKVIKHGQTEFTHTCSRCGCEFTYEFEDIQVDSFSLNSTSAKVVKCPDCGNTCYVNNNIGWPWPNNSPIPCNTPIDTSLNPCVTCDWWNKMTTDGTNWYVGDTPCTWCAKNPMKVTCGTTAATAKINDNSNTTGTLQLNPEDLKKYNLNIYGYQSTSGSNAIKNCNSCHKETKHSDNKNCNCKE
jgi:hypothetical protein